MMQELYRRQVLFSALKTISPAQSMLDAKCAVCELCSLVYASVEEERERLISVGADRPSLTPRGRVTVPLSHRSNPLPRTDFHPLPAASMATDHRITMQSSSLSLLNFASDDDLKFIDAPLLPLFGTGISVSQTLSSKPFSVIEDRSTHQYTGDAPSFGSDELVNDIEPSLSKESIKISSTIQKPAITINEDDYDDYTALEEHGSLHRESLPLSSKSAKSQQSATTASAVSEDTGLFQQQGWF